MTVQCAVCGHENPDDEQVCQQCGTALVRSGVSLVGDFAICLGDRDRPILRLAAPKGEGYVMGRTDEASDYTPDIDLAEFGAREQGVSRRHAALVRFRGTIHILDLGSVNGTYVNGRRLLPDVPCALNAGDGLKLGNMSLSIVHTTD